MRASIRYLVIAIAACVVAAVCFAALARAQAPDTSRQLEQAAPLVHDVIRVVDATWRNVCYVTPDLSAISCVHQP